MFRQYTTKLAPSDKVCQDNVAAWKPVLEKWEDVMQWAAGEGPSKHVAYASSFFPSGFTL